MSTCCSWCNVTQGCDSAVTFTRFKLNQAWHTPFTKLSKEQNWPKLEGVPRAMLSTTMPAFTLLFTSRCAARFLRARVSQDRIREECSLQMWTDMPDSSGRWEIDILQPKMMHLPIQINSPAQVAPDLQRTLFRWEILFRWHLKLIFSWI